MSVYKPPHTSIFLYDFQRGGRRFHGTTGRTARREAEAFERAEKDRVKSALKKDKAVDKTSINVAWDRFWDEKGQHDAKSATTEARLGALQDGLTRILRERNKPLTIGAIDNDAIATYVSRRRGIKNRNNKPMSNASVNRELQILRRIMRRAARVWRMEVHSPAWDELMLPEADERVVDMSKGEEASIWKHLRPDYQPAARWLILSGLRAGTALPLHPKSVNLETGIVTVMQKSRKPGGKMHTLPVTPVMRTLLAAEMGKLPDAVFTYVAKRTSDGRVRGQRYPLTPETFYNVFKAAAAKAGFPDLRPHDLRHVAGTRILRASGGNLRAAQRQLGHSRISTTTKYAHFLVDELKAAMDAAHGPEETTEVPNAENANELSRKEDFDGGGRS